MIGAIVILSAVTLQRLGELALARRNTRRLLGDGAREAGAGHYPLIVGLHAAWIAGLWWLAWDRPFDPMWLGLFLGLQALRVWVISTLGPRWTTRIVVLPHKDLVRRGPYRFLRHPNYAVVAAEMPVLPLVFHLYAYAAVFFLLNVAVLAIRIRTEEAALRAAA